jgi:hypothetical protein
MAGRHEQIPADRLAEAADIVLRALREYAEEHGGAVIYPTDLLGSPDQPRALCELTRFEVEQAARFLVRLGFIPPRSGA